MKQGDLLNSIEEVVERINRCEMPVVNINGVTFVDARYNDEMIHINWEWIIKITLYTGIEHGKEETYLELRNVEEIKKNEFYQDFQNYPIIAVINIKNIKTIEFFDVDGSQETYTF